MTTEHKTEWTLADFKARWDANGKHLGWAVDLDWKYAMKLRVSLCKEILSMVAVSDPVADEVREAARIVVGWKGGDAQL